MEKITIGADPEGWLYSKSKKEFIPIIGLLGGTKQKPLIITEEGHAVQEDNCSWEFNIPPVTTFEDFRDACNLCLQHIQEIVGDDFVLVQKPSTTFDPKYLKTKKATEIGCSADECAYTYRTLPAPVLTSNVRFAGGHIHIGWENPTWLDSLTLLYWLDLYLGVPFTLIDCDNNRKEVYGNAGRHRQKDYGVEYRVLSNLWLADERLMKFMWDQLFKAVEAFNERGQLIEKSEINQKVKDSIDSQNRPELINLIKSYGICSIEQLDELERIATRIINPATRTVEV